jgi:hypothetical protein
MTPACRLPCASFAEMAIALMMGVLVKMRFAQ